MKLVELTQGQFAMVDDEDYDLITQYSWQYHKSSGYAVHSFRINPMKTDLIGMQRFLLQGDRKIRIDHRDLNRLNNQRSNLRFCTGSQNQYNRTKQSNNKSGFKGVFFRKDNGLYQASIGVNNKRVHLGYHRASEEAAREYNTAAIKYHGEFANLNIIGGV